MSVLAPLLRPASWRLSPGAADVLWLRRLGLALLLASALALLSWCVATWLESWRHRALGWASVSALPLCVLGLHHAWLLGRSWLMPGAPLTLRWTGPVANLRSGEPTGGWRVDEWGTQPVDVSLMWDWQHVMLLRVRPCTSPSRQAWIWLQDRPGVAMHPGGEVHRLRTLLCLPPALTRPLPAASAEVPTGQPTSTRAGMVASSRHESPVAPARMNRARTLAGPVRDGRRPSEAALSAPLRLEDDFPATQVLDRWQDEAAEPSGAIGGRP